MNTGGIVPDGSPIVGYPVDARPQAHAHRLWQSTVSVAPGGYLDPCPERDLDGECWCKHATHPRLYPRPASNNGR